MSERSPDGAVALPADREPPSASRPCRRRHRLRRLLRGLAVLLLVVLVGLGAFGYGLLHAPITLKEPPPPRSAVLLDAAGQQLAAVRPPTQREDVPAQEIPAVMRQAMVAAEDAKFFDHEGVDPAAVARAAYHDLVAGSAQQGGSTITQQYVKNVYVGNERSLGRKIKEAALAIRLEQKLPKDEILTRYLNLLYLGNGATGVQAGAKFYFGVPARDLSLGQAAMLAGMAPAPSLWNPVRNFDIAKQRQRYVLNQMVAAGYVTAQEASTAYNGAPSSASDIVGEKGGTSIPTTIAPEFVDLVKRQLLEELPGTTLEDREDALFKGGLRVRTTLDPTLQRSLVDAVAEVLPSPQDPSAAVVAIDPRTGDLKALTTRYVTDNTRDYQRGGFNLATDAARSSGSTIKPFTLAAALENGHSLSERVTAPRCGAVPNPGGKPDPYTFCNAGDSEAGTFSLATALQYSVNTVFVPLALDVGLDKVLTLAGQAGLAPAASLDPCCPARALGVEVTPLSVAQGYATLAAHGVRHDVRTVLSLEAGATDTNPGYLVQRAPEQPKGAQVIPPAVADQVMGVMQKVVEAGTATAARQPFPVAGKTGTTNDYTNAWFVGCTPELCIATWMGYDKQSVAGRPHQMLDVEGVPKVFGGTLPAAIFSTALGRYRDLLAAAPTALPAVIPQLAPGPAPAPVPAITAGAPSEAPSGQPSSRPRPRRSAKLPQPSTSRSPSPSPPSPRASPSAAGDGGPSPGGGGPSPGGGDTGGPVTLLPTG